MSEATPRSNRSLLLGLAVAVALALGVGLLVYQREAPAPPPVAPSPTGEAAVSPEPAASSEPEAPPSTPAGAPSGADAGAQPGVPAPAKPPGKAGPREKPSLGGPLGTAGAPPPLSEQAMMRRRFVPTRTTSENIRGAAKNPAGFDSPTKDVTPKRAPEVDGRIEFSTNPTRVRPGDGYKVIVSFVNEGKRAVEVKEIAVLTTVNGQETTAAVKPLVKSVASNQNEVIYELTGTWDKATTSWGLEVQMTSGRRDVYRNSLLWK